jgi:aarF domain-containing kinase
MHPNVQTDIEADLDLMRVTVRVLERLPLEILADVKWLNLPGVVEEIAGMLKIQLDLRTEADHLRHFNRNFANSTTVVFPKVR